MTFHIDLPVLAASLAARIHYEQALYIGVMYKKQKDLK